MPKQTFAAFPTARLSVSATALRVHETPHAPRLYISAGAAIIHRLWDILRLARVKKSLGPIFISLLVGAILPASSLHASTIFSNVSATIPQGSGAIQGGSNGTFLSDAFAFTPATNATFSDALIDLWTLNGDDGNVSAALYSTSTVTGNTPGTLLAQLDSTVVPSYASLPSLPFSANHTTFTQISGSPVSLTAGSEYWLVVQPGDLNSFLLFALGGATANLPLSQQFPTQSSAWTSPSLNSVQLQIDGTPTSSGAPEPGTFGIAAAAILALGLMCWCRRVPNVRQQ